MELDTVHCGDALAWLKTLPDESVHCIVTSPPYFGLRDYGMDGQMGLEPTPREYVDGMTALFREARRVLRSDGTLWVNLGDSYNSAGGYSPDAPSNQNKSSMSSHMGQATNTKLSKNARILDDVPRKGLFGIPWRVAFALQDDGWILRSDIIWHKPNPMPESVTDRPTKAHEYVFLLSKSERYWYDADAIKEPCVAGDRGSTFTDGKTATAKASPTTSRNKRDVWTAATEPTSEAHFATFPTKLIEPMILAGCPARVCAVCGAPHERTFSDERAFDSTRPQTRRALELFQQHNLTDEHLKAIRSVGIADAGKALVTTNGAGKNDADAQRLADEAKTALGGYYREFLLGTRVSNGWRPACACNAGVTAGIVLDPFIGSGTTALVARRWGRRYLGCDLNPEYVAIAERRLAQPYTPDMFATVDLLPEGAG